MSSKLLKRVYGDAYLAPMKLDQSRPITAGAPLRRCSNDISISIGHATDETPSLESFKQTKGKTKSIIAENTPSDDTITSSKVGDGDMKRTPSESEKVSSVHSRNNMSIVLPVPAPPAPTPVSAASFLSGNSSFKLTFRKPKPRLRPRSIITNSSFNEASLRNTASTPSPISPAISLPHEKMVKIQKENNPTEQVDVDINNNVYSYNDDVEQKKIKKDINNNDIIMSEEELDDKKLSKSLLCLKDSAVRETVVVTAMPADVYYESTNPLSGPEVNTGGPVFEPDEKFWHSDSTVSIKEPEPEPVIAEKPAASSTARDKTDMDSSAKHKQSETTVITSTPEGSKKTGSNQSSQSYNSLYPYYGAGSNPDGPFLKTEKGAIRFHLPGKIQHKTTIKVAHFPTGGDEKSLVLNVKPEKEEEEPCVETPSPYCANNKNFFVPPPPSAAAPYYPPYPYNYNPYGYGGGFPYSPENYYRYYGYSPYPC